jgi:predicted Rossmann fold flavoprotein
MAEPVGADERCDIAVIGAGAAGLAAAIFAAETAPDARIVVLDSAARIGAKILISGGGRCNVTHDEVRPADFNGAQRVIRTVLAAFDERAAARWFASLGVPLNREETGKLFPVSNSARTVLDALIARCDALRVRLQTSSRVQAIRPPPTDQERIFSVQHGQGALRAGAVIVATGGRSLPRTGSDGSGWAIVRRLGHTVTETAPALVPLLLDEWFFHARLAGVSLPAELTTLVAGKPIDRRSGSLLWTHTGISGPVAMDASRHWLVARAVADAAVELRCSVLPGRPFEQVESDLLASAATRPRLSLAKALAAWLPERLGIELAAHAGIEPSLPLAQLSRERRRALCHTLTGLTLPVLRDRGWNYAEATAGGVPLDEIDARSMQSRLVPGLYLAGEMLDCDGRIGGFNFQWAWSSGHIAGTAAGRAFGRAAGA